MYLVLVTSVLLILSYSGARLRVLTTVTITTHFNMKELVLWMWGEGVRGRGGGGGEGGTLSVPVPIPNAYWNVFFSNVRRAREGRRGNRGGTFSVPVPIPGAYWFFSLVQKLHNQKVNINIPFTLYYGLITSIPTEWKKLLRNQNNCSQTVISTLCPTPRTPINKNRLLFSFKQSNKSSYIREQNLKLWFHAPKKIFTKCTHYLSW